MGMAFNFKVGDRVKWRDPDRDNPCDGDGTITSIQGDGEYPIDEETIISVDKDDGGYVEVLPHEIKKIKKEFPEMEQMIIRFQNPIEIPTVWKDLLALDSIPRLASCLYDGRVDDPIAYRDDRREITVKQGEITVYAILCSGNRNYWVDWELWDGPDIISNSEGDPEFDIPESMTLYSNDNKMKVEVQVKFI